MRNLSLWILPGLFFFCALSVSSQSWTAVAPESIRTTGKRDIIPQRYVTFRLDYQALQDMLWISPREEHLDVRTSNTIITVAMADGTADRFRMVRYDMMEPALQLKYPEIRTFWGVSVSNPYRTIRADWTHEGFRAVIRDPGGKMFIDPFQRDDPSLRIVYYKRDYLDSREWSCGFIDIEEKDQHNEGHRLQGDCMFRSYRLALATTGEYSNYFGATSPAQSGLVLSQVITAVNRVNEVYEADLTVRLILVGNTTDIFYYNSATDPYTNNNGSTMLGQNQTTCDGVIGNANYDIGHVFSTGGGGVASVSSVCIAANKARGVTGSPNPVGDPFTIDYVAHEMGHQFGASHTFNGTTGSCNGNRTASSAYEPGSGSTIMAYAGICGTQNLQPNSDAYMHARSILQISNHITSTSCAAFIPFNNTSPIANATPDYTIPVSTPFVLTASATDADGDPLTYCWEQYDLENPASEPPTANDSDGPLFRSFIFTSSSQRFIPRLENLVANINSIWEVLPSVSRPMNFRLTVRDYHSNAGCTAEDNIIVTTNSTAGPFVVTSQNSATIWLEGSNEIITWNVANTNASPVNCSHIDIYMSTDGGLTYPVVLSLNEPNDGSATVSIPPGVTTMGRIMVKASNNIFFDINNTNITINPGLPNFTLALDPMVVMECNDGVAVTTVDVGQFMGFSNPVTLSLLNPPPGAVVMFDPPVVDPGSTSTLTITNLDGLFGIYTPTVRGTSTTGNKDIIFTINLLSPPDVATLISPADNTPDEVITPFLNWEATAGVTSYEVEVAYDSLFENVAWNDTVTMDQVQITTPLNVGEEYFWRVRAVNGCGTGGWSATFNFTTISCFALMSPNVPVVIPASGTPTVTSTFTSPVDMIIDDINVIQLTGLHSWVDDLRFSLISPDGTERLFWDRPCGNHDDFNIQFDDEAANGNWPCPPTNGLTYRPDNLLNIFDGEHSQGIWTLKIQDLVNQDGGSLTSWGLRVCGEIFCGLSINQVSGDGPGSLSAALLCASPGDTIRLDGSLSGQTIDIGAVPLLLDKDLVILAGGSNISITGSGDRVFEIDGGVQIEFLGFRIMAGLSMEGGVMSNEGVVRLRNMTLDRNPDVMGATLVENGPGAEIRISGVCTINQ